MSGTFFGVECLLVVYWGGETNGAPGGVRGEQAHRPAVRQGGAPDPPRVRVAPGAHAALLPDPRRSCAPHRNPPLSAAKFQERSADPPWDGWHMRAGAPKPCAAGGGAPARPRPDPRERDRAAAVGVGGRR